MSGVLALVGALLVLVPLWFWILNVVFPVNDDHQER